MVRRPFVAEPVGTAKARGVVHHRAASKAATGEQGDGAIGGGREAALVVELSHHRELQLVEVRLVVIAALFEDDDVFAG